LADLVRLVKAANIDTHRCTSVTLSQKPLLVW